MPRTCFFTAPSLPCAGIVLPGSLLALSPATASIPGRGVEPVIDRRAGNGNVKDFSVYMQTTSAGGA
jgi:hypothetical protein